MPEELSLVTDLAVILIAAGVFTIISKALKQPLILGYIIAGFIVGPHLGLFPKITSMETVDEWSEIGIIFLLFALGLEFSFKKLIKVGSSAITVAGCIFLGMFILGLTIGKAMGWSTMESLFLGGMLPMSSTTIIIKAYDDLGLKKKPFAPLVFGTLVVEDLLAILVMVLLTAIAVSNRFSGGEMLFNLGKLGFFLILWFLVGIFVIPSLLKKAHKVMSDEILLIVSIGLCFGMVAIANYAGFSSALGAFVMGSILAETIEGERIEHVVHSIKDLFGAIFFVSVGMMVDPVIIGQNWVIILILALVAMGGILFFSTAGSMLAGQGLDNSVHTGFSMAQLGEFAFIIAGLGCSLGVMRDFIYPVVIAVSVLTTFTTPYMMKLGDPAYRMLQRRLPQNIFEKINPSRDMNPKSASEESAWKRLIKSYILRVVLYSVILLAILLGSHLYLEKAIDRLLPALSDTVQGLITVGITLVAMIPFLYGLAVNSGNMNAISRELIKDKRSNAWPIFSLVLLRIFIAVGFVIALITTHFTLSYWVIILIILGAAVFLLISRTYFRRFTLFEKRFIANLNEKEELARKSRPVTTKVEAMLAGYDVHLEPVVVSQESEFIGRKIKDIPFRSVSGANIVKIQRGSRSILIPSADEAVYPSDRLLAVGTGSQIEAFRKMMENSAASAPEPSEEEFVVEVVELGEDSFLTGKCLHETDMRPKGCMVISMARDGQISTNPRPDMKFQSGDIVWLAGSRSACEWFR